MATATSSVLRCASLAIALTAVAYPSQATADAFLPAMPAQGTQRGPKSAESPATASSAKSGTPSALPMPRARPDATPGADSGCKSNGGAATATSKSSPACAAPSSATPASVAVPAAASGSASTVPSPVPSGEQAASAARAGSAPSQGSATTSGTTAASSPAKGAPERGPSSTIEMTTSAVGVKVQSEDLWVTRTAIGLAAVTILAAAAALLTSIFRPKSSSPQGPTPVNRLLRVGLVIACAAPGLFALWLVLQRSDREVQLADAIVSRLSAVPMQAGAQSQRDPLVSRIQEEVAELRRQLGALAAANADRPRSEPQRDPLVPRMQEEVAELRRQLSSLANANTGMQRPEQQREINLHVVAWMLQLATVAAIVALAYVTLSRREQPYSEKRSPHPQEQSRHAERFGQVRRLQGDDATRARAAQLELDMAASFLDQVPEKDPRHEPTLAIAPLLASLDDLLKHTDYSRPSFDWSLRGTTFAWATLQDVRSELSQSLKRVDAAIDDLAGIDGDTAAVRLESSMRELRRLLNRLKPWVPNPGQGVGR